MDGTFSPETGSPLAPPAKLHIVYTDPETQRETFAFPLQTAAWLKLQIAVSVALQFPLNAADFTEQYGDFADKDEVLQAVSVLSQIRTTAAQYGDPQTLISDIEKFQQASPDDPPASLYGHAVFLSAQVQNAAADIVTLLQEGLTDIGNIDDPEQRLQDLTELLTGQGGVNDKANALVQQINTFSGKISAFLDSFNPELAAFQNYIDESGNVLQQAQQDQQTLTTEIGDVAHDIHELNKEYIGFTVAAVAGSVLFAITIVGLPLAVADAAVFGTLAALTKKKIDHLQDELKDDKAELKQKVALVGVLTLFNKQASEVEEDGQQFVNALDTMVEGWTEFTTRINDLLDGLTAEDLADWSKFMQQVNFQSAKAGWQGIGAQAEAFFDKGFVRFDTGAGS